MSRQRLVSLTIKTLEKMRSDRDFDLFYELILKKASAISTIGKLESPKKRNKPNYSLFQYFGDRREASSYVIANQSSSAHQHLQSYPLLKTVSSSLGLIYSQTLISQSKEKNTDKNWITSWKSLQSDIDHPHYGQSFQSLVLSVKMEIQPILMNYYNSQNYLHKWKTSDEKYHYHCENNVSQ